MLDSPMHYFAYGSNLSVRQMAARCPAARVVGAAVLRGYRLCFPRRGSNWPGGVASIVEDERGVVEGAVYRLTEACVAALDACEGVSAGRYERAAVRVEVRGEVGVWHDGKLAGLHVDVGESRDDHALLTAFSYVARLEPGGPFAPSPQYVRTIIEGAREHRLSQAYLSALKKWMTRGNPA